MKTVGKTVCFASYGSERAMRRKYVYTLNSTGRRTSATDWDLNAGVDRVRRTVNYSYDQNSERQGIVPRLNRLAHEDIVDNLGSLGGSISHAYDLRSNQSQVESSVSSLSDWTGSFSLRDEMTDISGSTQTYDANGNLIQGNGFINYFDAENRLIRRATATVTNILAYDFEGNRVWKLSTTNDSSGTYYSRWIYVFDDKNPTGYAQSLAEYWHYSFVGTSTNWTPASWMFHKSYAYGNGPLWLTHYNGGAQHGHYDYGMDGHGSVRALFSGGSVFAGYEYDYDAYGNLLNTPPEVYHSMIRYAGEYWDYDMRTYYLRSRQFDPRYGRFTTSDSFEGSPNDPLSLRKYLYCAADPVNRIDPSGFEGNLISQLSTGNIFAFLGSRAMYVVWRAGQVAMRFPRATKMIVGGHAVLQWWGYAAHPEDAMLAMQTGGFSNEIATLRDLAKGIRSAAMLFKGLGRRGQALGIAAILTKDVLGKGTEAAARIQPPGWNLLPEENRARGHLLANVLGGPGDIDENLVTMYQTANLRMKAVEMRVRDAVEAGNKVNYIVTPRYGQKDFPESIHIYAEAPNGFKINETIQNIP